MISTPRFIFLWMVVVVTATPGCRQMRTGLFEIRGQELGELIGEDGSGGSIEPGKTSAVRVRRMLGRPFIQYDSTDLYDAAPKYSTVVYWWPVVITGERSPRDAHKLLRIDYDDRRMVERIETIDTRAPVPCGEVPAVVSTEWPDLRERKPAFNGK